MQPSGLDDPTHAAHAWGRFREIMGWMIVASGLVTIVGLYAVAWQTGPLPWHLALAAALGIFFTMTVATALMGLVFLSSGTGHDESIHDHLTDEDDA